MDRVDSLAEHLVGLRTETGQTLNNQQASTIIALWQNLLPYDQQRVAYAARHQMRLTTGCFSCLMSIKTTLIHWHNKRLKRQECSILLQGDNLPASIPVAPAPLPPVLVRPTAAPPQPGPQHQYHLPRSTAGQAVVKRKSAALAQHPHPPPSVRPRLQAQRQLFPQQAPPPTSAPLPVVPDPTPVIGPFVFLTPQVPAAKLIAPAGPLVAPPPARRAYNRTVDQNKCVKCHQPTFRLGPCVIFSDTTTRTLILFSITRSNIWTDSNTWANTFQAHFDVGIGNCHHQLSLRPSSPHHPPSHCYNCSSPWATFHDPSST
ncbi:hypothetical protein SKAU_G00195090 [Synaphobranchus kaupii]|uniref:Uncharacterized protein n=1 Tax=Synaphobranchus kaupii TaxID=118154 RepID=A0A9Q1FEC3_SYNKA|nr:hypothetical protein SKAU_G00195090 [Synaphobranchus kaupii]